MPLSDQPKAEIVLGVGCLQRFEEGDHLPDLTLAYIPETGRCLPKATLAAPLTNCNHTAPASLTTSPTGTGAAEFGLGMLIDQLWVR